MRRVTTSLALINWIVCIVEEYAYHPRIIESSGYDFSKP